VGNILNSKKKVMYGFIFLILLIGIIPLISAVKPSAPIQITTGLSIQPTEKNAIRQGIDHEFEVHVFNVSNGKPITSGITCYLHLYNSTGQHFYEGVDATASHTFDYSFNVLGGNFSSLGNYQAKFQCNSTTLGGGTEVYFTVNNFGEELSTAHSIKFNSAMFFMLILFLCALFGLFTIDGYIGKFVCYWVVHLLFIVGTFSMWQFNWGYTTVYLGMALMWKIMFYISIIAVFPMMLISLFWVIYIHVFNEHFEKIIRNGGNTEDAFRVANRKSRGWWNGKK